MGRCRPVSDQEADTMESHCQNPQELALLRFFRHTASRSNETSSLVISDLLGRPPGQGPRTDSSQAYEEGSCWIPGS